MSVILLVILLIVLLSLSAFFSGSETALFSISQPTLNRWKSDGTPGQKLTASLMDDHHSTLTAILLGNCFVNLLAPVVLGMVIKGSGVTNQLAGVLHLNGTTAQFAVTVVSTTILLLAVGEVTPKAIAYTMPTRLAPAISPVIRVMRACLSPVIQLLKWTSGKILKTLSRREHVTAISVEEYQTFTHLAHRIGVFDESEIVLFEKIFSLHTINVGKLMIPRPDIRFADMNLTEAELDVEIRRHCHNMLPLVDGDLDNVVGILDARRFAMLTDEERRDWQETCIFAPIYVPENAKVNLALARLRESHQTVALVVNEYGGVEGLITAEDIYEQIVGDVLDEYDQPPWQIAGIGLNTWRLTGHVPLEELAEKFSIEFDESESDTVAGFMAEKLNHIPHEDDEWAGGNWLFRVRKTHRNRVLEVDMSRLTEEDAS